MTPQGLLSRPTLYERPTLAEVVGGVRLEVRANMWEMPADRGQFLEAVWDAYWVLHVSRTQGFSCSNPIPVSEIKAYLDLIEERDVEVRLRMMRLIKVLDGMFQLHVAEKADQKSKQLPKQLPRRGRP